jgi:hypothetical protein
MGAREEEGDQNLEEVLSPDVETSPNEAADPQKIVDLKIPADIRKKYEVLSYRNAAVILSETRRADSTSCSMLSALLPFPLK